MPSLQHRQPGSSAPTSLPRTTSPAEALFGEAFAFDFFQAVRILEKLDAGRCPVGTAGPPRAEAVRFRAHVSLSFPPSAIYEVQEPTRQLPVPIMTVAFMGLTGPSGALPRHYTELLLRLEREGKGPEKRALRDWLDLFNHRLISLFYRAWAKYRFYIAYEHGEYDRAEPDSFTRCLFSLVGLGMPRLRHRLRVAAWGTADGEARELILGHIDDLALLHYGGFLATRRRSAVALEALLEDYFQLPVRLGQFHGQWLQLDLANQSRLGGTKGNNELGVNVVAGDRVWDVQNKIRLRLGPLRYSQFIQLIPDRAPLPQRKVFYLLCHLTRLFAGAALDFDVQLVLQAQDVPECQLAEDDPVGARLGWNTWVRSQPFDHDADEAVFAGEELVFVTPVPPSYAFTRAKETITGGMIPPARWC